MAEEVRPLRLARRIVYENPWVSLYVDRVRFPGGRLIEAHHVLHFDKEAVASIVEDGDGGVLLVEAYRYVVNAIQWELPAGSIDLGESILAAAAREVREESGYRTIDHRLVASFEPINGIGDKVHHLVHCRAVGEPDNFDENEVRAVKWVKRDEAQAMVRSGEVRDGYTLTGLLWWLLETAPPLAS
ncbi:MAG TPA: NUDIX hydrolase [Chloroflexi bacterium]|nr:NUDIX hydrolase [Chloroflexota bacterium]HHW89012.1 NUDIX hydrolase [Chloroflexota bacterium]